MAHTLSMTLPEGCRWAAVLLPDAAKPGEGQLQFAILAADVTAAEVALTAHGLVGALMRQGQARFPTDEERDTARARQALLEEHPATRILGRDGEQLWIGDAAVEAGVLTRLAALGWTDCGKVQVKGRACDWKADPAFEAKHLPDTPEA